MRGKIIVPLLLASLSTAVVTTAHQISQVSAEQVELTNVVGDIVEITKFNDSGKVGDRVYLPTAVAKDDAGTPTGEALILKIIDPAGRILDNSVAVQTDNDGEKYFEPGLKGYYTLSYSTNPAATKQKTTVETLRIYVEGADYSLELPTNSKYVIPSVIPVSTTNALKIPAVAVYRDGEKQDDFIKTGGDGLKVYVLNKNGMGSNEALTTGQTDADGNYVYSWMPTTAGIYEIVYRYFESGTVQDYITQRFVVKEGYDTSKINLSFSYSTSRPTTAILGQETSLPKINIIDKTTGNAIEGYASVIVEHVGTGQLFEVEDFKFTPTLKGKYRVTYQARLDYFGKETTVNSFIIDNVKDTLAPTVLAVNNYTLDVNGNVATVLDADGAVIYDAASTDPDFVAKTKEEKEELLAKALSNLRYAVPSVAVIKTHTTGTITEDYVDVSIPAIYGKDNFSTSGSLTYTREVRSSSGVTTPVTEGALGARETATYRFKSAGNYTIRYIVKDEAGNQTTFSYDIKILATDAGLKTDGEFKVPTIEMQALSGYVKANSKLVFNRPTATDEYDTRVEVKTYYSFTEGGQQFEITQTNDADQLVLNLAGMLDELAGKDKIYITAKAINDYAFEADGTTRKFASVVRVINLINTQDSDAPTWDMAGLDTLLDQLAEKNGHILSENFIDTNGYLISSASVNLGEPFVQQQTIVLPTVKVTDETDPNLSLTVTVKDPNGKAVKLLNSKYTSTTGTPNEFTIGDGQFVANYSGLYTVTYTAKDSGGNIITKTFALRVKDTEKPTILLSSFDPFTSEVEVGKFIEVPKATLKDNGKIISDLADEKYFVDVNGDKTLVDTGKYKPGISWNLVSGPHDGQVGQIGFTPSVAGEYVIIYTGWDENGNTTESRAYTIVAKDTIKPTIVLESDHYLSEGVPYVEGESITIPGVQEYYDGFRDGADSTNNFDQTDISNITLTVKVKDNKGNEIDVEEFEDNTSTVKRYTFIPTGNGVYTITYTAIDPTGNTTTITKTVEVGDVEAPTLVWASDYSVISTANVGDSFELNMNKATITDDSGEFDAPVIVMYNPSDNQVESLITNGYKWQFDEVGTYQIKITLTDEANNTQTYTYSIEVTEKAAKEQVIEPWLGTTLIVVTSLILAGVVIYFIVTSKNGKLKTTAKRRTTKK